MDSKRTFGTTAPPSDLPQRNDELFTLPLQLPAGVKNALDPGEVGPPIEALTPVVESPDLIQLFHRLELLLEVIDETHLHFRIDRVVGSRLIVKLIADHVRVATVMFHNLARHAVGIEAVVGIGQNRVAAIA